MKQMRHGDLTVGELCPDPGSTSLPRGVARALARGAKTMAGVGDVGRASAPVRRPSARAVDLRCSAGGSAIAAAERQDHRRTASLGIRHGYRGAGSHGERRRTPRRLNSSAAPNSR
jgi:hypothetical protein